MDPENEAKKKRNLIATANQYQEQIIFLVFLPSALTFLGFICIALLINPTVSQILFHTTFTGIKNIVNLTTGVVIILICLFFIISLTNAFILSNNMLGAMGRINRELDDILAGKSQTSISSRPNDTLTKELLKRINVLIKFYVEHRNKYPLDK